MQLNTTKTRFYLNLCIWATHKQTNKQTRANTHTHTHISVRIYIYIYIVTAGPQQWGGA